MFAIPQELNDVALRFEIVEQLPDPLQVFDGRQILVDLPCLSFGYWNFFGICYLLFEIFLD